MFREWYGRDPNYVLFVRDPRYDHVYGHTYGHIDGHMRSHLHSRKWLYTTYMIVYGRMYTYIIYIYTCICSYMATYVRTWPGMGHWPYWLYDHIWPYMPMSEHKLEVSATGGNLLIINPFMFLLQNRWKSLSLCSCNILAPIHFYEKRCISISASIILAKMYCIFNARVTSSPKRGGTPYKNNVFVVFCCRLYPWLRSVLRIFLNRHIYISRHICIIYYTIYREREREKDM